MPIKYQEKYPVKEAPAMRNRDKNKAFPHVFQVIPDNEVKEMSSPVRFVHCAGFCFDSRYWEGPSSWVSKRNQDLWQTFRAVLKLCRTKKADFLFLTGDLFEQEYVHRETVERISASLARLDGTRVFISPVKRILLSLLRLIELSNAGKRTIFAGDIEQIAIPERGVRIYGAGWTAYIAKAKIFLKTFKQPACLLKLVLCCCMPK
jgi:hypothetical protein